MQFLTLHLALLDGYRLRGAFFLLVCGILNIQHTHSRRSVKPRPSGVESSGHRVGVDGLAPELNRNEKSRFC